MNTGFEHHPVMVDEIVDIFGSVPAGPVVDATLGGGGHANAILSTHPHLSLIGIDRDDVALAAAAARLASFDDRITLRRARFDALAETLEELGVDRIAGALFDLGVSSPQLDVADRGFSYRQDGPLDMRMDRRQARSAADVVNTSTEAELRTILHEYGDERYAARIAKAIVAARPVTTTVELAELVRDAIPAPARRKGGHPAKRSFQALRIEVNGELDALRQALDAAVDHLDVGGRCAVLSYHSGEDKIVNARFRALSTGGCTCPPGLPCVCGAVPVVRELRPRKRRPSAAEAESNRRAQSAVLRVVEKLEVAR